MVIYEDSLKGKMSPCALVSFVFLVSVALLHCVCGQQEPPTPYDFRYAIDDPPTGNYFGQAESGDQAGRVSGSYYVRLPDARLMIVEYYSDENGFVPKITFQPDPGAVQG